MGLLPPAWQGFSIAVPQGTTTAVDNPAGHGGSRQSVRFLRASVVAAETNATFGSPDNHNFSRVVSGAPQMGFNYQLDPKWTLGVSITGAGLAARYTLPALPVPGAGPAKASLLMANISPTVTYKPLPNLSVGASLIVGIQQFRASGVLAPGPAGPVVLPSHGDSYAAGLGAGVGVLWAPTPILSVGASYYTKTRFSALDNYKDDLLAASGGHPRYPIKVWNRYRISASCRS
ncbi:OmpP1/FadL family transporter [Cupriavidus basilensis]